MASNFKILIHRSSDNLHLKLMGDFDGSSAYQLINVLKKANPGVSKIFIHTSCLRKIIPFGRNVFIHNLRPLKNDPFTLVFTGDHASELSV